MKKGTTAAPSSLQQHCHHRRHFAIFIFFSSSIISIAAAFSPSKLIMDNLSWRQKELTRRRGKIKHNLPWKRLHYHSWVYQDWGEEGTILAIIIIINTRQLLLLVVVLRVVNKSGGSFKSANYFHQSITHHRQKEDAINIGSNPLLCFVYIYQRMVWAKTVTMKVAIAIIMKK